MQKFIQLHKNSKCWLKGDYTMSEIYHILWEKDLAMKPVNLTHYNLLLVLLLTSSISFQSAVSESLDSNGALWASPALFTTTSTPPSSLLALSKTSFTFSSLRTSHIIGTSLPGNSDSSEDKDYKIN